MAFGLSIILPGLPVTTPHHCVATRSIAHNPRPFGVLFTARVQNEHSVSMRSQDAQPLMGL
jgi:hypothetical protein